jgi:phosphoglycolate phosphatase
VSRPLAVFDVDGTLVDSRESIHQTMTLAFEALGLAPPAYEATRRIVGLNLAEALDQLAPDLDPAGRRRLVEGYRAAFQALHRDPAYIQPLYAGAAETLARLRGEGWAVAMATGKSRRGVETIVRMHGWADLFDSTHCADDGPGKPDPAMLVEAMRVLSADRAETVMIGDTAHDILMARAAGVRSIGVTWGFHTAAEVAAAGADEVVETWPALDAALDRFAAALLA